MRIAADRSYSAVDKCPRNPVSSWRRCVPNVEKAGEEENGFRECELIKRTWRDTLINVVRDCMSLYVEQQEFNPGERHTNDRAPFLTVPPSMCYRFHIRADQISYAPS